MSQSTVLSALSQVVLFAQDMRPERAESHFSLASNQGSVPAKGPRLGSAACVHASNLAITSKVASDNHLAFRSNILKKQRGGVVGCITSAYCPAMTGDYLNHLPRIFATTGRAYRNAASPTGRYQVGAFATAHYLRNLLTLCGTILAFSDSGRHPEKFVWRNLPVSPLVSFQYNVLSAGVKHNLKLFWKSFS